MRRAFAAWLFVIGVLGAAATVATQGARVVDLDGNALDPLAPGAHRATVLLFVCTDCPISNRYIPEIKRLASRWGTQGIRVWLVYPDAADSTLKISQHLDMYDLLVPAIRDPRHVLVRRAGATVTPEAAVFDAGGVLRYHGRIDDRYLSVGVGRPYPSERTLENAAAAVASRQPVATPYIAAVGCVLADMQPKDVANR